MASFDFVDSQGTAWMVLAGLPADLPESGGGHGPMAGLTFRSSAGELRVLPHAAIPRSASAEITIAPFGTRPRIHAPQVADWETLLRHAIVWP